MRLPASVVLIAAVAAAVPAAGIGAALGSDVWIDGVQKAGLDPAEVVYPFSVTPAMKAWAEQHVQGFANSGPSVQLEALQDALFDPESFRFEYDEDLTLTAAEAFETGRGNCMSFTAMFIALSRAVGIPTVLVSVRRSPDVVKSDDLVVVNRHVVAGYRSADKLQLFDFYVTSSAAYIKHWVVDDVVASAMYHTNLGGAAIRNGDLEDARRQLLIATTLAPAWAPAWVNLGVAHYRLGDSMSALDCYRHALDLDDDNTSALTNMAFVYRQMGLEDEARAALFAAAQKTSNPFTLIAMADVEMQRGKLDRAHSYLRRAKWWYKDEPEVYDALARLAQREGEAERAFRHAARAAELRRAQERRHENLASETD